LGCQAAQVSSTCAAAAAAAVLLLNLWMKSAALYALSQNH